MRDVLIRMLAAIISVAAVAAQIPDSTAKPGGSEYLWLSNWNVRGLQRELQAAAERGFRFVPLPADRFFIEAPVLLERTAAQPEPIEYLVVFLDGDDLDAAAAQGYRFTGEAYGAVVMERRKGASTRTHEYQVVGARLKNTVENELLAAAEKGFRIVGITKRSVFGILRDREELAAILERPVENAPPDRPEYLILYSLKAGTTQAELQAAADRGYRLPPFHGGWGSTVLLEKTSGAEPIEYLVLSTSKTESMQKELDKASAGGYRFASTFGSGFREFVVAMQRPKGAKARTHEQAVLATSRFKTMERESLAQLANGFRLVGLTSFDSVMGTFLGRGPEGVAILERRIQLGL